MMGAQMGLQMAHSVSFNNISIRRFGQPSASTELSGCYNMKPFLHITKLCTSPQIVNLLGFVFGYLLGGRLLVSHYLLLPW